MSEYIVELRDLSKEYFEVLAIDSISLQIPAGEIFGLIGPNGAGKTTILRIMATTLEPTSGKSLLMGKDIWADPVEVRRQIGFMPDFFQVYNQLTVREFLKMMGMAHGLRGSELDARTDEVIGLIGLSDKSDVLCKGLSRGMVQRLGLGRAIIHKPKLLLLDEPASGLDPLARKKLFEVLLDIHSTGTTIIISSHILDELSGLCTSVGMVGAGRFLEAGPTRDVIQKLLPKRKIQLRVLDGSQQLAAEILNATAEIANLKIEHSTLDFEFDGDDEGLVKLNVDLVNRGVKVVLIQESQANLHDAYITIAGRN